MRLTSMSPRRVAYRGFPQTALLVDTASHMILSLLVGKGPRPDAQDLGPLLDRSAAEVVLHRAGGLGVRQRGQSCLQPG